MKKYMKYIIVIIISVPLLAYSAFAVKNQMTNTDTVSNVEQNRTNTKQDISLEVLQDDFNKEVTNLNLYKKFEIQHSIFEPLYTIDKDYLNDAKTTTGKIMAVSSYMYGTYKIDNDLFINVFVIQDKTFENGGFIFVNMEKNQIALYKHKNFYLMFEFIFDLKNKENNIKATNFIGQFYKDYENVYNS